MFFFFSIKVRNKTFIEIIRNNVQILRANENVGISRDFTVRAGWGRDGVGQSRQRWRGDRAETEIEQGQSRDGVSADQNSIKLIHPPVHGCITHQIEDYIPCVYAKVNRVGFQLVCTHRWRLNLNLKLIKRASNWTKSPLYLGKKGFLVVSIHIQVNLKVTQNLF